MKTILDSNVLIYAVRDPALRAWIEQHSPYISSVSVVETLGYPKISADEDAQIRALIGVSILLPVNDAVIWEAAHLRQQRRMSLGDALIAATALVHGLMLVTRNTSDFRHIAGLVLLDPLAP